jgi:hypothetical protein
VIILSPTACAFSLAVYLQAADLVAATSVVPAGAGSDGRDPVIRSFLGTSVFSTTESVTAISDSAPILLGADSPEDEVIAQIAAFRDLKAGWDGLASPAPNKHAIRQAVRFIRLAGDLAQRLEPTIHADGSILLEIGDGSEGSLKFQGDGQVTYAIQGTSPGTVAFLGSVIPDALSAALSSPAPMVRRAA